ncbi:ATP-binding protein [Nocardioides zeae]|uniref:Anti-sigma regulatory factor (Ser/Thr protein kinase) n=1 Tax=Nocardioides zeae TaxID=1457234 RepID=A0AAJ1U2B1_9ACTN|nr:ATP-binding protein [Nocardioides zeae]MDQ1106690.1 anti-sigma regulatory factor (Ser/Thr protein kinase) [Nocardioides zeae]
MVERPMSSGVEPAGWSVVSAAGDWVDLDLPHGAEAVPLARKALREAFAARMAAAAEGAADQECALDVGRAEDVLQDVLIVAGELVINAVDHGRPGVLGTVRLSWRSHEGRVYLRMTDAGYDPAFSQGLRERGDPASIRGRGLFMVDAICEQWSVASDPATATTQVTACLAGCARRS